MYEKNRGFWDAQSAAYQHEHGATLAHQPLAWGVWRIPEADLRVLEDMAGLRLLELGCGAAQWTVALRAQGIAAIGLDLSGQQLRHARVHAQECGVDAPLVHGDAQQLPFRDAAFDVVFCDHGAMTFASPEPAIMEASRVLRDEGLFAFCMSTPIRDMHADPVTGAFTGRPDTDYFSLGPLDDGTSVTAQLPYGEWIRLFRRYSFRIDDLIELQAPLDAQTTYVDFVDGPWARRWPGEHIWKVRRERRRRVAGD